MTRPNIQPHLKRDPFVPLRLRLASGQKMDIEYPDSAFVRGRWGLTLPDGKKPGGLFTLVFKRMAPEGWRIVHDHTSAAE